jgi:DNA ligase-1
MHLFSATCERIAATTKKLEKTAIVAEYLNACTLDEAATSAVFLSGRPFPIWEETTLQVGGTMLWRTIAELAGKNEKDLTTAYRKLGDLGAVAGDVLPERNCTLNILDVEKFFREIAAVRGPSAKEKLTHDLLARATPQEAKYIVKIMTGDLRIGLKESLVEEAIAKAYGATLPAVQRANMLLGDIGETLRLAARAKLNEAHMRVFHPLGFMLASPAETSEDALSYFENASVEDKYDGVRAQAHCSGETVRFFSRTRDEITESFPELPDTLTGLPQDAILDGEIVAWDYVAPASSPAIEEVSSLPAARAGSPRDSRQDAGATLGRALPFSALQQRLGRKKVSDDLMRKVPVAYLAFDVLYAGGELLIDRPMRERGRILEQLLSERKPTQKRSRHAQHTLTFDTDNESPVAQALRAPIFKASSPQELDQLFEAAQARGNEGLMIKDPVSPYTPGRRGKSWLKLKRELATLDVVVTAAEYGHGKRIGVLSDYTFAVRDGEQLANIGKAYSGLTDIEITEMTKWFLEHTIEDQGFRRIVEPKIVLKVAFNNMMRSDRHESGYALRFPRIVRLRPDKLPEDADTIERAQEIYEKQSKKVAKDESPA